MPDIPANTSTTAVLDPGPAIGTFSGRLDFNGDHDWVAMILGPGTHHFYLSFLETGSLVNGDSTLVLRDGFGTFVTSDVDGVGDNSIITFATATGGFYFLDIGESGNNATGTYSIFSTSLPATDHLLSDAADTYTGAAGERILGGKGIDVITLGAALDALGEQGDDAIFGNALNNLISGGLGNDTMFGGVGGDIMFGDSGNDNIFGNENDDFMRGGAGNDILNGGAQFDVLIGGIGKDYLTGGPDADNFRFFSVLDSKKGAPRDVIVDFSRPQDDAIDLSNIDAKKGGLDDAFRFIGRHDFHDKAGELHYIKLAARLLLEGDTNGDGRADFQIEVHGVPGLVAGDLIL